MVNEKVRIEEIKRAAVGDPFGVGRDPELQIAAVATGYEQYKSTTLDPDATLRFTEVRAEWLGSFDAFAKCEKFSPFVRYYFITDWLLSERVKRGELGDEDESEISGRLDDLWWLLYEPEMAAMEWSIENLKKKRSG